jgi:hypothetical protein
MTDIPVYTRADRCPKCASPVAECTCGNMLSFKEATEIVAECWSKYTPAEKRNWLAANWDNPIAMALVRMRKTTHQ